MRRVRGAIAVAVAICAATVTGGVSDAARRPVCKGPGKIIRDTPKRDVLRGTKRRDTLRGRRETTIRVDGRRAATN